MANFAKWLLEKPLNIDPSKAGKTLLGLNAIGMAAASASDTFAAAIDKNTSAEDKKFLIPAGIVTGLAKIGIYFTMTTAIINKLQGCTKFNKDGSVKKTIEGVADKALAIMEKDGKLVENATEYTNKIIKKAEKGLLGTGLFKKSSDYVDSMKQTLKNGNEITDAAKTLYKNNFKSGFGVLGAFVGAVVGSAILTPIIRDVGAWAIQKIRENKNPELKGQPYKPYINVSSINANALDRQPLNMKNYMSSTSSTMKI